MKEFRIEMNGKIYGKTSDFEWAKKFSKILGDKAIVFAEGGIVAYQQV